MRIKSKYNGLFFPEGSEGSGHLRFSSTRSNLKLVGEFYHFLKESYFEVYGTLANGAHVSLHQCISVGVTSRVIIRLLREQLGPFAMPVLQCIGGRSAFEH